MRRFKNLLAVVDDPSAADALLMAAHDLADRNDASLTVMGIVDQPVRRDPIVLEDGTTIGVEELLADDLRAELADRFAALGLDAAAAEVPVGFGFIDVVNRVVRDGHDIVFVGSDASPTRSSLVMHLLRKCPVPVWVETPRGDQSADVAVAVGPFVAGESDLNPLLMQFATSLAESRGGALHVVHAWRLEGESQLRRRRAHQRPGYVDELVELAAREARLNVEALVGAFDDRDVDVETHLIQGQPGQVIPEVIDSVRPGVLVLGTLARAGLAGLFMGNTAETVLSHVASSLMAVKPEGFVAPV